MNIFRTALAMAALIALAGTGALAAQKQHLSVTLEPLNMSGESGTAAFTQTGGGVQVVIRLKNAPADAQPTHIHAGTCGNINKAPEYPLNNTVGGKSTTVLKGVQLSDLASGKYAVNVHKSTSDLGTYVACGNIK